MMPTLVLIVQSDSLLTSTAEHSPSPCHMHRGGHGPLDNPCLRDDADLLATLANQSSVVIRNAQTHQRVVQLNEELHIGLFIQYLTRALTPFSIPRTLSSGLESRS